MTVRMIPKNRTLEYEGQRCRPQLIVARPSRLSSAAAERRSCISAWEDLGAFELFDETELAECNINRVPPNPGTEWSSFAWSTAQAGVWEADASSAATLHAWMTKAQSGIAALQAVRNESLSEVGVGGVTVRLNLSLESLETLASDIGRIDRLIQLAKGAVVPEAGADAVGAVARMHRAAIAAGIEWLGPSISREHDALTLSWWDAGRSLSLAFTGRGHVEYLRMWPGSGAERLFEEGTVESDEELVGRWRWLRNR